MAGASDDTLAPAATDDASIDATLPSDPEATLGSKPPIAPSLETGGVVGRFVVLSKLGAGGMGVVYAAYDPELDRKVALKLLLPSDEGTAGSEGRARLLREAQALGKLNHPNVVGIHDVGTVGDRVWIAMEYVDGHTLGAWLKLRRRGWREVLDVMTRVARGVAAAHAAGLLHRDLKPDNVMVGTDGRVRVMDFGLARTHRDAPDVLAAESENSVGALAVHLTRAGALLGTPAYMAPEQFEGKPATAASDQFSLCVTFWEALYGQRPFAGRSLIELMSSVLDGEIQAPPRGVRVPNWLVRPILTGLARDPAKRFASVEALLASLARGEVRTRVRRAGAAIGLGGLVVAGVMAAQYYDEQQRAQECTARGDAIDDVWNAESRAALRAGLIATEVPYAPAVADKVMPWVDRQASAWRTATTRACMNTSVHGTWDEATLDKATFCLDDRRVEIATLVRELANADATMVQRAVDTGTSLSPIATCIDEISLAGMSDPPSESLRPEVTALREQLSRAAYLESAGKYDEGLELARSTRDRAEALDWPPISAAAQALEAELLGATGAYAESETIGIQAYLAAGRARSWDVAANAALRVTAAIARQGRGPEARVWVDHSALASSLGGDPLQLREAERLLALGNLHSMAKEYDDAARYFERATAIWSEVLGPEHPRVALGLNNRANVHLREREYHDALEIYRRVLKIRERALGPEHPEVGTTLFNIGLVHDEMGDHEDARVLYERALALEERALGRDHPELASTLINLGNALQRHGDFQASKSYYQRALSLQEVAFGPDHVNVALTLDNLAIAHEELREFDAAKPLFARALAIRQRTLPPDDPEMAHSLRNLGELQLLTGEFELARASFESAIGIWALVDGPDALTTAKPTQRVGECLAALERFDEALPQLERALALRIAHKAEPDLIGESGFALASVLWDAPKSAGRDRDRARALAEQARVAYYDAGLDHELAIVEAWLAAHP